MYTGAIDTTVYADRGLASVVSVLSGWLCCTVCDAVSFNVEVDFCGGGLVSFEAAGGGMLRGFFSLNGACATYGG